MHVPDFLTHYHPADDPPFNNLSDLLPHERDSVIAMLMERRRANADFHRVFGPKYLPLRLETEAKLRALLKKRGGKPARHAPHYFVLGSSKWFEGLYPQTRKVVIPIASLREVETSITYPDSFTSMRLGQKFGLTLDPLRPYHEQVYRLSDLPDLVGTYGIPVDEGNADYSNYAREPFEKYIEVQVWSDDPVAAYLQDG